MREQRLKTEIEAMRALLLRTHYFEEARWLDAAVATPEVCAGEAARQSLRRVHATAREFGFEEVAAWLAGKL